MEQYKIYLLHKLKIWTENKNCFCAHIAHWNELNLGGGKLFGMLEKMAKFHPIWKHYEGTSSTNLCSGQKLWKIAQGARVNGLSWYLVSMGYLTMLNTLPNCSSIGLSNKALPLQNFREGRNLHWIMCQILNCGIMILLYSKDKLHNLCGNFLCYKNSSSFGNWQKCNIGIK